MKPLISVIHADTGSFIDSQLKGEKLFAYKKFFQLQITFRIADYTKKWKIMYILINVGHISSNLVCAFFESYCGVNKHEMLNSWVEKNTLFQENTNDSGCMEICKLSLNLSSSA